MQLLGGGGSRKTNIEGRDCLKGGLEQFADLRGAWQERAGDVFEGGWYPIPHYDHSEMGLKKEIIKTFNKLFNNILDEQFPFFHWEFLSFHRLCDFVAVTSQFYFVCFF